MDILKRTIKAISIKQKAEGKIGFLTEDENWYNLKGDESVLDEWLKSTIKKGNEIEFETDNGIVGNIKLIKEGKLDKKWEDEMVTFEDLLTKAHALKKPFSIKTEMLAVDLEKKYALFKAAVIVDDGMPTARIFEGHGDATIENVKGSVAEKHWIRMGETRSIVRALRWYTNNGCAEEEK